MTHRKTSWRVSVSRPRQLAAVVAVAGLFVPLAVALPAGSAQASAGPAQTAVKAAGTVQAAGVPQIVQTWSTPQLNDAGNPIALSSPVVADLPGGPAAVVGDRDGYLYAFSLASGAQEWKVPNSTGIDAAPSAANVGGGADSVFVGVGTAANGTQGYYEAVNPNGSIKWTAQRHQPEHRSAAHQRGTRRAVRGNPAGPDRRRLWVNGAKRGRVQRGQRS